MCKNCIKKIKKIFSIYFKSVFNKLNKPYTDIINNNLIKNSQK